MPTSSIALVLFRLFALGWMFTGLWQAIPQLASFGQGGVTFFLFMIPVMYIGSGAICWFIAPKLSRLLTKGDNGEFNLEGVTTAQLYATVFLGLGAYFTLSSFGDVFNWIHFFAIHKSPDYGFHRQGNAPSYYELTKAVLTLLAGIVFVFNAGRWGAKLGKEKS